MRMRLRVGSRVKAMNETMRQKIVATIRRIPRGKVSTYGAVARAAGFPGAARQVVAALRGAIGLPWQRVLGAGGAIKLRGDQLSNRDSGWKRKESLSAAARWI